MNFIKLKEGEMEMDGDGENNYDNYTGTDERGNNDDGFDGENNRLHVPFWVIFFLIIVIVLDIICMVRFPRVMKDYKIYNMAEERIQNSETSAAINDLYELAKKHTDSTPIMIKTAKLSMENGYYDTAAYIIDEYLAGSSVSDSEYDLINNYYTKLDNYYATSEAISKILNIQDAEKVDLENIKIELKSLLNQDGQDDALVYYYLGIYELDRETSKKELQECYNLDPECYDVRAQLSVAYRRLGDLATAKQFVEEALHKDKYDSSALRSMSIIAMLEGNLDQGVTYAKAAYDSYPDGIYVRETYLIALTMNSQLDQAQQIKEEMQRVGENLEDQTLQLLDGDLTLEEYYIGE